MINLGERSYKKELLDDPSIPFEDIKQNMRELNSVNTYLGGHKITLAGVKAMLQKKPSQNTISICEIGCGGGDNLQAIFKWCNLHFIKVNFIGIDIKAECIQFAAQQYPGLPAQWIISDYKEVAFEQYPDIIFSSLFCHHFTNDELAKMMLWMKEHCKAGFFINDLHRHQLAYYSIKMITSFFSRSYLVKNDAPLSVARGFKRNEWIRMMQVAGIKKYSISWKWAFRYLIVCCND